VAAPWIHYCAFCIVLYHTARTDGDVSKAVRLEEPVHVIPDFRQPADDPLHPVVVVLSLARRSRPVGGLGGAAAMQLAGQQAAYRLGVDREQDPAEVVMGQLEIR